MTATLETFDLSMYGFEELDEQEMMDIDGGIDPSTIYLIAGGAVLIFAAVGALLLGIWNGYNDTRNKK
jgi:lactobin A/cerein 7B family class IIb bacteriocin